MGRVQDLEKTDHGIIIFTIPAFHWRSWVKPRKKWLVPIQPDLSYTEEL
jgi:hypothetical protein